MSAVAAERPRRLGLRLHPERRLTELLLLVLGAGVGLAAAAALALAQHGAVALADLVWPLVIVGLFLALHFSLTLTGRGADPLILPVLEVLALLGFALVTRLAVGLEVPQVAQRHATWLVVALSTLAVVIHAPVDLAILRRYRYTWLLAGVALVGLTFLFGHSTVDGGPRLWLGFGTLSFQPSEVLKLLVVAYLAGYLADKQELLAESRTRLGPLSLPPLGTLAPMLVMLGLSLGVLFIQRDLGASLLLFVLALGLIYIASGRLDVLAIGLLAFAAGAWLLHDHVAVVQTRTAIWLDPWSDAQGTGYQLVQALLAIGAGGVMGTGLGFGEPTAIPAVHTDFVYAALAEELGLAGATAVLGLYVVLVLRGFRSALTTRDEFERLLAAGLALALAVQTFIIVGGVLKLIPLTGITLPFLSYGGTSLVATAIAVGLILRIGRRPA